MPDRSGPGLTTAALSTGVHQGGGVKRATGAKNTFKISSETAIIGTWNVRTLYACGKIKELEHELQHYEWDIIGLAEIRWTGIGEATTEDGHKLWYSGDDTKHQHGVGFIVNKKVKDCVLSCTPFSSRLITIRVSAKPMNITIIQVYAPTSEYEDQEVEELYEEIEKIIQKAPKKDLIIVQGDFNAKIGPDAYKVWAGTVGRYGVGETNDRGLRLLEFASSHRYTIANTLHPHKISRRTTWHSPDGKTHNQVDFIMVPRRFKSSINRAKTRSYPGADVGSDHDLVLLTIKIRLKKNKTPTHSRIKFDIEKLKDPSVAQTFQAQLGGRFAALSIIGTDINELTASFNEVIKTTAAEVLGKKRKKKQPWITNDILDLCDRRREQKKYKHNNEKDAEHYRATNKLVRSKMREAKERWINEQCREVEEGMSKGNSKKAYKTLKLLTKIQQNKTTVIEDKDGNLLTESSEVLNRWAEYCKELYNFPIQPDASILERENKPPEEPSPLPIMREEVEAAIRSLPPDKSPGADNIPAELLKHGGKELTTLLTTLCQKIWDTKEWPKEWTKSLIIPLPKKGNLRMCQNYRTISLISHASKVLLRVILNRLKSEAEEHLAEEQAGFRAGRSTVEQIFNCRIMMEKHLQHQKELYHNFIDFKKAFDRVWHDGLWHSLRGFGIKEGLVQIMKSLYSSANSAVLLNNNTSEYFRTTVGVRQGCLLSPVLFNLYLEQIMRDTLHNFESSISIGGRKISNLRFADDIDLMGGSNSELQELTDRLSNSAKAYGMEVSCEKSKVMVNGSENSTVQITMNGQQLEEITAFKYLGAVLTKDGRSTTEIKTRLAIATSNMAKLSKIWSSNNISFSSKIKLYRALVLSTLLYGCESWTLTAETTKRIQTFENKCYRRMLGISWKDRKTNDSVHKEITARAGPQENLVGIVKRRKLAWFGHITRHDSLAKTVMQGTLEGGRKRGRQAKCWADNLKEWTRLDSPTLTRLAEDRLAWRSLSHNVSTMSPLRLPSQGTELN